MSTPTVLILMYHGVSGVAPAPAVADPHYTLPAAVFAAQLDGLLAAGMAIGCARDGLAAEQSAPVWLTFDDGDLSNYQTAFPLLCERDLRADFFVNPSTVGTPGYCSWAQLREMAAAGMSIQSHGYTHTYFTEHSVAALRDELQRSRSAIEQEIGQPVTLLAPPGGRAPRGLAALARDCGYQAVLGSVPGAHRPDRPGELLPRVALTAAHDAGTVLGWARSGSASLRRQQLRYQLLALAKRSLGDRRYERLRGRLLGGSGA